MREKLTIQMSENKCIQYAKDKGMTITSNDVDYVIGCYYIVDCNIDFFVRPPPIKQDPNYNENDDPFKEFI